MILSIRTDNPQAEVGLFNGPNEIFYKRWEAHRELSETVHVVLREALTAAKAEWSDISGVVFYKGPGSFTGLRIGASVANSFGVPVACTNDDQWVQSGIAMLESGNGGLATPEYGAEPHITVRKK